MGRDAPPLDGQQRFSPYKQENAIFRIGKTGGKYYMENMAEAANYRNPLIRGKVGDRRKWHSKHIDFGFFFCRNYPGVGTFNKWVLDRLYFLKVPVFQIEGLFSSGPLWKPLSAFNSKTTRKRGKITSFSAKKPFSEANKRLPKE